MIRRTTWIIIAIFVVLLGVLLYLQRNPIQKDNGETTPTPQIDLISFAEGDISAVRLKDGSGKEINLEKSSGGTWALADPPVNLDNDSAVQSMLAQIAGLTALSELDNQVQADVLGLDPPLYTVAVTKTDGSLATILVGMETPTGSGYYLRVNDGPVYVVSKFNVDTILTPLTDPSSIATATPTLAATATQSVVQPTQTSVP